MIALQFVRVTVNFQKGSGWLPGTYVRDAVHFRVDEDASTVESYGNLKNDNCYLGKR
ncbi:hypothetical protein LMG27177_06799 [Paraburkholderia fynbosensis]|uniref:Uncharacterized protein n=1 Tax=Paraburkholderia fynbosensis TaxID=1200993 RepID=A0A6J5H083_9BURK|nr:hypothetical protein LMG27177_06799 [Paraburkholderia fynbosensis]